MKPRDISVSVVDLGGSLLINTTFQIEGSLPRDPNNEARVLEPSRKQVQKALKQALEEMEIITEMLEEQ
jgi:hypothetical protein